MKNGWNTTSAKTKQEKNETNKTDVGAVTTAQHPIIA